MSNPGLIRRFLAFLLDYIIVAVLMFILSIPLYHLTDGSVVPRLPIIHLTKTEPTLLDERQVNGGNGGEPIVHRSYLLKITYYGSFETYQIEDQTIEPKDGYATRTWQRHSVRQDSAGDWQHSMIPTSTDLVPFALLLVMIVLEASAAGASPGKRIMGLRVVDMGGQRIDFATSLKRNLLKIVSIVPLGIGIFMAMKSNKTQTLHDRLTQTQVISTKI